MYALAVTVSISSCAAYHSGNMANSASLNSNNFMYSKMNLQGTSTATYVLGIGGLAKESLVNEAKQQLLATHPLKDGQTLANLTVSYKNSGYFGIFYRTLKCTVTADIVEFK